MMSVRITGYDIVNLNRNHEENILRFQGVAHLEVNKNPVDMPFEGVKLREQFGFNEFFFKDPDEVRNHQIEEEADEILGVLSDHLLDIGVEAGEYNFHAEIYSSHERMEQNIPPAKR